jgi:hypothetical protein
VGGGNPEDADHGVPDELLHDSAVGLDRGPHLAEVREHQLPNGLGIDPLRQGRRACHVCEQQRRRLAALFLLARHGHSARIAESRRDRVLAAAEQAARHSAKLAARRFHASNLSRLGRRVYDPDGLD